MAESSPTIQDLFNTREVSLLDALLDGAISKPDGKQGEGEHLSLHCMDHLGTESHFVNCMISALPNRPVSFCAPPMCLWVAKFWPCPPHSLPVLIRGVLLPAQTSQE